MNQSLTPSPTSNELYSTVTSKGQVTIPVAVRKHLGITANDKIAFVIQPQGTVEVKTPKYPTLASLAGADLFEQPAEAVEGELEGGPVVEVERSAQFLAGSGHRAFAFAETLVPGLEIVKGR